MKKIGMAKMQNWRSEDPREALLKYADKAQQDPLWTKAYQDTQPAPQFTETNTEEDEQTHAQIKRRKVFF